MPPHKRSLTEADINRTSSTAKKVSANSNAPSIEKEDSCKAGKFDHLTNKQLVEILKQSNASSLGSKNVLIGRVESLDAVWRGRISDRVEKEKAEKAKQSEKAADSKEREKAANAELEKPPQWICICRPHDDIRAEKFAKHYQRKDEKDRSGDEEDEDADEDDDEEEEDYDEDSEGCGRKNCVCRKPSGNHPDHKWLIAEAGYKMWANLQQESLKRDQDAMDQYQYNDFTGYGFQEVVENHLVSFNKAISKKGSNPWILWYHIESLAHFVPGPGHWWMSDDSERILETLKLIGFAVLSTLKVLDKHSLLTTESPVKDLTLVLGLLIDEMQHWPGGSREEELLWIDAIAREMEKREIKFQNPPFGIEKTIEDRRKYPSEDESEENEDEDRYGPNWRKFSWRSEFSEFKKQYGIGGRLTIGGTCYDLTKQG